MKHLIGHRRAKKLMAKAIASERLAHSYLFRGPDGVGKRTFARVFAESIFCQAKNDFSKDDDGFGIACGHCRSCVKLDSGNHPDFMELSPEGGLIKIDRIRDLQKKLTYPPYESEMRVVVIEDVHLLQKGAANSLLKTIEEPADNNLLILTAESSSAVLPTIISRCQVVPFDNLTIGDTELVLRNCAQMSEEQEFAYIAELSEGSPGRAIKLSKTDVIDIYKNLTNVYSFADCDIEFTDKILLHAEEMSKLGKKYLPELLALLRLNIRNHFGEISGDKNFLFNKLKAIDTAEKNLMRNCNPTLVCEILLFDLTVTI